MKKGVFVISLDFEMMWGVKDIRTPDGYGQSHITNVYQVIPEMLKLFEKYNVKATIATVGLIMLKNKEEALKNIPAETPSYKNMVLSPYADGYIEQIENKYEYLYFAPSLIEAIKMHNNIEIGTHTFCHYNCYAPGQTVTQFEKDLQKALQVANKQDLDIKSIVFPRNQVSAEYLSVCGKNGIVAYRGNAVKFFTREKGLLGRVKNRLGRLLDNYVKFGTRTSYDYSTIDTNENPINIRASRFLRSYNKRLSFMEPLSRRRIKKEIQYAARHNEVYHLWWHPHNFGANSEKNLEKLEYVLRCYSDCHNKYGMRSYTMAELALLIKGENGSKA